MKSIDYLNASCLDVFRPALAGALNNLAVLPDQSDDHRWILSRMAAVTVYSAWCVVLTAYLLKPFIEFYSLVTAWLL